MCTVQSSAGHAGASEGIQGRTSYGVGGGPGVLLRENVREIGPK